VVSTEPPSPRRILELQKIPILPYPPTYYREFGIQELWWKFAGWEIRAKFLDWRMSLLLSQRLPETARFGLIDPRWLAEKGPFPRLDDMIKAFSAEIPRAIRVSPERF
jgi:hypothetical protein